LRFLPWNGGGMKYLCLVYQEEAKVDALPGSEYDAIVRDELDYSEALQESGHYIASGPLQPVETATTIRVRNDKVVISDGPFAETKEQLGSYYLIEARDLNDAIRVVSRMPSAQLGCIEVRPVKEVDIEQPPRRVEALSKEARNPTAMGNQVESLPGRNERTR